MKFDIINSDKETNARTGKIVTDHGIIKTPIFMPVGTCGSVKGVHQNELLNDTLAQNNSWKYLPSFFKTRIKNNRKIGWFT